MRTTATILLGAFVLLTIGTLLMAIRADGTFRSYHASNDAGESVAAWGLTYPNTTAGTALAVSQLLGVLLASVASFRKGSRFRRPALGLLAGWSALWAIGIARVALFSGQWLFLAPWLGLACGGLFGSLTLFRNCETRPAAPEPDAAPH